MIMQDREVNPQDVIDEGKTVDEAIEKGLERLGLTRDQVEVDVLEEGARGVLGLVGVKQAKVVVRRKDDMGESLATIEELATGVLNLMGVNSQVEVSLDEDIHKVKIDTAGADGLLIGKKGQNLMALEHLLRRMAGKQLRRSIRLEVDVGGYKERRVSTLRSKAISMASRVKASNKEMQVEPLSAAERRIIHVTLAGDSQVKTYTIGDGELKTVVIAPQRRNDGNPSPRERRD
jgi:spoIIIJ-associated protein